MKPNEELENVVRHYVNTLALGDWEIHATISDKPGGNEELYGHCECDQRYKKAYIELKPELAADENNVNVAHELLHILHNELDTIFDRATQDHPNKEILSEFYTDALEHFIMHMASAITEISIPPPLNEQL